MDMQLGVAFWCGFCHTPINDAVWQSCRICLHNVDFHKECVAQGRQLHHKLKPTHGFKQVTLNANDAEDEAVEGQLAADIPPAWVPPPVEPDIHICFICEEPITGTRHFCTADSISCRKSSYCGEHVAQAKAKHVRDRKHHVWHPPQSSPPRINSSAPEFDTSGARAESMAPETSEPAQQVSPPLTSDHATEAAPSRVTIKSPVPEKRGKARKVSPPQANDHASEAHPRSARIDDLTPEKPRTRRRRKVRDSVPAPQMPPPRAQRLVTRTVRAEPDANQKNVNEEIAKGISNGKTHMNSLKGLSDQGSEDEQWLFKFQAYIRTWSESADPTRTANGFKMLIDFDAFTDPTGRQAAGFYDDEDYIDMLAAPANRNIKQEDPLEAAILAKTLNRRSIKTWANVMNNGGMVGGQTIATMGIATRQDIAKLMKTVKDQEQRR